MTRPKHLHTKIFLDSGDPEETKKAIKLLGFLDGQTTNPSLVAKNPQVQEKIKNGESFTTEALFDFYKNTVEEISKQIPEGSISIEVYADKDTTPEKMIEQARIMNSWIPNAHIKLPVIASGLESAEALSKENLRLNMTLVFNQEQAAAVYSATKNAFVSPFVGRLDDRGENGMDLIKNVQTMYEAGDEHVEVLVASVRTLDHFLAALALKADIVTVPLKLLKEWKEAGMPVPYSSDYNPELSPITYKELTLGKNWQQYDISDKLTDAGLQRFADDWNALLKK